MDTLNYVLNFYTKEDPAGLFYWACIPGLLLIIACVLSFGNNRNH